MRLVLDGKRFYRLFVGNIFPYNVFSNSVMPARIHILRQCDHETGIIDMELRIGTFLTLCIGMHLVPYYNKSDLLDILFLEICSS